MIVIHPINGQTWLICGGRKFSDQAMFDGAMSDILSLRGCPSKVVHGKQTGADMMADAWAKKMAIRVESVEADWIKYGRAAGPIRNEKMLREHTPSTIVAFPGGDGTRDMVRKAHAAGVEVIEVRAK